MKSITRFRLDINNRQLLASLDTGRAGVVSLSFPMEFLRVIDLQNHSNTANQKKNPALVTNRKEVKLIAIESVGKHGFRLLFDDQFQKVLSVDDIEWLHQQQTQLWQQYLDDVKESGLTRETAIDIKAL